MDWTVEIQPAAEKDLELIFDHLFLTYQNLGEDRDSALDRASARVIGIRDSAIDLATNPYRGTKRDELGENIRNVTIDKAIVWFELKEQERIVRILAFFFGGQDHQRHMLRRLLS